MKRNAFKFGAVAFVALALAGCSSASPNTSEPRPNNPATPAAVTVTVGEAGEAGDVSMDDGSTLFLTDDTTANLVLGGSGSCPPVIESATFEKELLTINMDEHAYDDMACTMDFRLYSFEITLEGGDEQFSATTQATLVTGEDESQLKVRPATAE